MASKFTVRVAQGRNSPGLTHAIYDLSAGLVVPNHWEQEVIEFFVEDDRLDLARVLLGELTRDRRVEYSESAIPAADTPTPQARTRRAAA